MIHEGRKNINKIDNNFIYKVDSSGPRCLLVDMASCHVKILNTKYKK